MRDKEGEARRNPIHPFRRRRPTPFLRHPLKKTQSESDETDFNGERQRSREAERIKTDVRGCCWYRESGVSGRKKQSGRRDSHRSRGSREEDSLDTKKDNPAVVIQ